MKIVVSQKEGRVPVTVFQIQGEITLETGGQLEKQARDAMEAGTRNLLLDLTKVTFISSSGLRVIHQIFLLLRSLSPAESDEVMRERIKAGSYKSPHLKLLNPRGPVLEALTLAGFDMFLQFHTNLEEAVASF